MCYASSSSSSPKAALATPVSLSCFVPLTVPGWILLITCISACLEPGLPVMLGALEAGVGACALSLPGALQLLGIQGQLPPPPHSLPLELKAFRLRGVKEPAFPGLGGSAGAQ